MPAELRRQQGARLHASATANVEAAVVHREPMQAEVVWKLVRQPPREGGLTFDTGRYQLTPGCTPAAEDARGSRAHCGPGDVFSLSALLA